MHASVYLTGSMAAKEVTLIQKLYPLQVDAAQKLHRWRSQLKLPTYCPLDEGLQEVAPMQKHDFSIVCHAFTQRGPLQAEAAVQAGSVSEAEGLFLRAKQPDLALQMYRKALMWDDALRIAEDYLPAKVCLLCSLF